MKKARVSGAEAFDRYFGELYGERWPALKAALVAKPRRVHLTNPFSMDLEGYALDEASLAPVRHLNVRPGDRVADFCASPGGKLIASIFAVHGEAHWIANDFSAARVARLKAVLHDCLPPAVLARVRVFHGDASRWGGRFKETFDRILVDAPCSGERHLLERPKEIERWTLTGSKRLAVRQNALLCAALDALRPGGRLVYSTCSISEIENDGVVDRLHKSRGGRFVVENGQDEIGEPTRHGRIILPDRSGCGPIYFSILGAVRTSQ